MDFHCFSIERVYSNLGTWLESWQRIGEKGYFLVIYQFTESCKCAVSNWYVECLSKVSGKVKNKTPATLCVLLNSTRLNNSPQKKFQFFLDIPKRHFGHSTAVFSLDQGILSRKWKRIKVFLCVFFPMCFRGGESSACLYWFSHFFFQQIVMSAVNMSHALELNTGNIEINKKIAFPFLKELSLFGNGNHTNKSAWLYRK